MIVSYQDKRTRDFAAGQRIKAFFGIERAARLKLDRLEAAVSLKILLPCREIASKHSLAIAKANTASGSTTNGGFVSNGPRSP